MINNKKREIVMAILAPIPLYYSIIEFLMKEIEDGKIHPADMIMSERELMEKFDMSRTTVRKALDVMVNEGYLYRIQGKGTFVAEKKKEHGLDRFISSSEEIRQQGMTPRYEMVSSEILLPRAGVAEKLGIEGNEKIFRLERVLYADEIPVSISISHIPAKFVPGISKIDFSKNSLYETLENEYSFAIHKAERTIEATSCGDKDCKYLQVSPHIPVLLFKGIVYGKFPNQTRETPIEYFFAKYRSDKYKLHLTQMRG